mmetsp:Transcript_26141/g.44085  ORF Transcript_26141/g.44085 Transcript_26141/m.44085 type:complete len:428 (+) Transcript_26141:30-1313(+)
MAELLQEMTALSASTQQVMVLCALLAMVLYYVFFPRKVIKGKTLPMPSDYYPIIGHVLNFDPDVILSYLHQNCIKFGGSYELSIVGKRALVLTEWESMKDVLLRRPKMFRRDSGMDSWGSDLNVLSGCFNVEGANEWGRIRRLSCAAFAPHHVDGMSTIITDECIAFLKRLDAAVIKQKQDNVPIDGVEVMMQYTLNVIINLAFGSAALNSRYLKSPEILPDMKALFTWIFRRLTVPFPSWVWNLYNDSLEQRGKHCSEMLDSVVADITKAYHENEEKKKGGSSDPVKKQSDTTMFLTSLIRARLSDDASDTSSRNHLSDTEIAAQIKTFLIAGTETTAVSIASAVQYLSEPQYTDIVDALYNETKSVLSGERTPSSLEQIRNMPKVTAFLKESMRLRGPAPTSFNELVESEKSAIIKGGYTVYPKV